MLIGDEEITSKSDDAPYDFGLDKTVSSWGYF